MALFRAVENAEHPDRRLFEDPYAIPLLSGTLKALAAAARWPIIGRLVPAFLDFGWPYTRSSAVVRTRMIDDLVGEAIRAGARQLVLLGAGFDSRAYRLRETNGIAAFEVDHPATQRAKRQRLKPRFGRVIETVRFVEVDFEKDDLERALVTAGFKAEIPAVVVWEGVVSYLTGAAVNGNLGVLVNVTNGRNRFRRQPRDARMGVHDDRNQYQRHANRRTGSGGVDEPHGRGRDDELHRLPKR